MIWQEKMRLLAGIYEQSDKSVRDWVVERVVAELAVCEEGSLAEVASAIEADPDCNVGDFAVRVRGLDSLPN